MFRELNIMQSSFASSLDQLKTRVEPRIPGAGLMRNRDRKDAPEPWCFVFEADVSASQTSRFKAEP